MHCTALLFVLLLAGTNAAGLSAGISSAGEGPKVSLLSKGAQESDDNHLPKIREFTDHSGLAWKKATTTRYWDCSFQHCANFVEKTTEGRWQCPNPQFHDQDTAACQSEKDSLKCADGRLGLFEHKGELYGTAAASSTVGVSANPRDSPACGKCYHLKVNKGQRANKTITLMVTNWCPECKEGKAPLGSDSGYFHFDVAVPGGGQGLAPSCRRQFPETPEKEWETVPPFKEPDTSELPKKPVWKIESGLWTQEKQDKADERNQHAWKTRKEAISKVYSDLRAERTHKAIKNCGKLPESHQDSCRLWYETFSDENLEVDFRETSCPAVLFSRMCLW